MELHFRSAKLIKDYCLVNFALGWQDFKSSKLEEQFNPRAALGSKTSSLLSDWEGRSALAREALDILQDIPYGNHVLQKFDYCKSSSEQHAIILLHGGYWRALDKSIMDCHVQQLSLNGFTVYNVNYPLCPEVTLTKLIEFLHESLEKIINFNLIQKDNPKIVLMGHSAGAHLAMHLAKSPIWTNNLFGVVSLSGIFECQVVREISVNKDVCLNKIEAENLSIVKNLPNGNLPYYIAVGAEEPSGWIDQSVELYGALSRCRNDVKLLVVNEANHFDLVDKILDVKTDYGTHFYDWIYKLSDNHAPEFKLT